MALKKPGLTLVQHDKLGIEIQSMYDRVVQICGTLSQAYPKNDDALAGFHRIQKELSDLKHLMEKHLYKEHRKDASTTVYYRAVRPDYRKPESDLKP